MRLKPAWSSILTVTLFVISMLPRKNKKTKKTPENSVSEPTKQGGQQDYAPDDHQHVSEEQQTDGAAANAMVTQPSSKEDQWHNEQKAYWDRQIRISIWMNWITVAGAVIAILALMTLITSHRKSERAWVTVKGITLKEPMVAGQEAIAVAGFHNFGHSPALETTVQHGLAIAHSLPEENKPGFSRSPGESLVVMGPDSKMSSEGRYLVTMEEMSKMAAGKAYLYSFGIVKYVDVFDTPHWSRFCYRSRSLADLNLVVCDKWNEVDKN